MQEQNLKEMYRQEFKYNYEKQKALDDAEHEKLLLIEKQQKERQKLIAAASGGVYWSLPLYFSSLLFID